MHEPTPPDSIPVCLQLRSWACAPAQWASLTLVLEIALGLRIVTAGLVDFYVRHQGPDQLCLFPDTRYYWELGRVIRSATTSQIVEWGDIPHFSLRTPGYPFFLAGCQTTFGERTLPIRLVQAALGTVSVYLVYCLAHQLTISSSGHGKYVRHRWSAPLIAALIAAVGPYYIAISPLILSEAIFEPLMLTALLGLALLWAKPAVHSEDQSLSRKTWLIALGSGAAAGIAILVRPSWALFVPIVLVIWVVLSMGNPLLRVDTIRRALVYTLGVVLVLVPWWYRNARIYGRFVPTALWMGASLYDGINPRATGASDMSFLSDREIWPLDEQDQDAELMRRSITFARKQPRRFVELALKKLARYWSPWPNAGNLQSLPVQITCAVGEVPFMGLLALGVWNRRRDPRTVVLFAGPVLYFGILHLLFASSMRYRIPAQMPAIGLAAIGWLTLLTGVKSRARTV